MTDIIPETGTQVTVTADSQGLDDIINVIQGDNILSQVLAPAVEQLNKDKETLKESTTTLANAVAERIKAYQEQFISMNQSIVTSNMHDTIEVDPTGDGTAEVGATATSDEGFPYPIVIEQGSRPHIIEGNPLLAFNWNGAFVITHSVQHPGTSPKPFVAPSLDYIKQDTDELFNSEIMTKLGT
ncbi:MULTISPECIES: hypothetical protein [Methanobacterium]|uniref:Uncharacterized protein n=1 Tax=Methanobacterium bryantii TaxID=2161 RepID=A0A2A2H904_METBR|nr:MULTISPECIES: hypothetical protein [Methanobacterium]OEC87887.1 hypothetical protein A9507_06845 [Methanobacterium sp. A39]PAV05754.1 hypothetical protein ASJ80_08455 [Methanobacterium bryantii]